MNQVESNLVTYSSSCSRSNISTLKDLTKSKNPSASHNGLVISNLTIHFFLYPGNSVMVSKVSRTLRLKSETITGPMFFFVSG